MKIAILALLLLPPASANDITVSMQSPPEAVLVIKPDGKLIWKKDKDTVARILLKEIARRDSEIAHRDQALSAAVTASAFADKKRTETERQNADLKEKLAAAEKVEQDLWARLAAAQRKGGIQRK
jgi:hypothetical protein